MSEPALELRNIRCAREDMEVRVASLCLNAGSSIFLMGDPSALLLLRLLSLQERPDAGEMWLNGKPIHALSEDDFNAMRCRAVGLVFSSSHLLPGLSAVENVAVPLFKLLSLETAEAAERTHAMLEFVGLQGDSGDDVLELSRADQQRVALARALVHRPTVLALHRAEEALAPDDAAAFRNTIRRACAELGVLAVAMPASASVSGGAHRCIVVESGVAFDPHAPVEP